MCLPYLNFFSDPLHETFFHLALAQLPSLLVLIYTYTVYLCFLHILTSADAQACNKANFQATKNKMEKFRWEEGVFLLYLAQAEVFVNAEGLSGPSWSQIILSESAFLAS